MNSVEAPRPLNLGEILDRTIQLYRERFLVYLGIALIPTGVLLVFGGSIFLVLAWIGTLPNASGPRGANTPAAFVIGGLIVVVLGLVALAVMLGVSSLSAAALNHAAAGALAGQRPTIRGSFAQAWRRGWMYVGLYVLQALIVWVAPFAVGFVAIILLPLIAAGVGRGGAGPAASALIFLVTLFGFMAIAGYALWMTLCVSLAFPGCVVEKTDAGTALKRSFRLSKGTRGRIFVLYLLGYVLGVIVSMVAFAILVVVFLLFPGLNSPQNSQTLGMAMVFLFYGSSFALQAATKPVYVIALMLFYYDQRIRNEGFDIEWMMERAGLTSQAATSVEWKPEPSEDATAPWSVDSPLKMVAMRPKFVGEDSVVSHTEAADRPVNAAESTEEPVASEAAEISEPTQSENGVQR